VGIGKGVVGAALALSLMALMAGCAGKRPVPMEPSLPPLPGEWREAQQDVARLLPPVEGDPYRVSPDRFTLVTEDEPFYCGATGLQAVLKVYGCFRAAPESESDVLGAIRYYPQKTGALRHEARHAILFALGDARWADVGH
jgi:hypothetical protein